MNMSDDEWDVQFKRMKEDQKNGFVACDSFCHAKEEPETLEEYKATLEHYKHHGFLSGCAHGQ